jgi:predicted molibdopterin-dependent oxidoreductase YjgC
VPAQGKPDFQIAAEIGARVGVTLPGFASSIFIEIAQRVPAYAGLTYRSLARAEAQWPDIGGRDFYGVNYYYGGTSFVNAQGLGVQLKSGAERGQAVAPGKVDAHEVRREGLTLVPTTLLYDRGATFLPSRLMHPRLPEAFVELSAADAARLSVKDGDVVTVTPEGGASARVIARVARGDRAPEGVVLMPESLGPAVPARATRVTISRP